MLSSDAKGVAYAAMDDSVVFELVVSATPPDGDVVVEVANAESVEALKPSVTLVRKMARTFFPTKMLDVGPRPDLSGPVSLYLVCEPPELSLDDMEGLSEEGDLDRVDEE